MLTEHRMARRLAAIATATAAGLFYVFCVGVVVTVAVPGVAR